MKLTQEQRTAALATFSEYFVKNYPGPHTIIGDPTWHAPKIFRAALHAIESESELRSDSRQVVKAEVCGTSTREFDPHLSPLSSAPETPAPKCTCQLVPPLPVHDEGCPVRTALETFDVKKEVMQNAGNSNKPDHAKPGAASGDNTPKCFFCGWPLETHSNNVQGHPWRRGSSVTDADLALNRQTETACGAAVSPTHQHGPECPILYGYACNCTPIPLGTK